MHPETKRQLDVLNQMFPKHILGCGCEDCIKKLKITHMVKAGLVKDVKIEPKYKPAVLDGDWPQTAKVTGPKPKVTWENPHVIHQDSRVRYTDITAPIVKKVYPMARPELFLITREIIAATHKDELSATYNSMRELNIAHLPYGLVDIGVPANALMTMRDENDPRASYDIFGPDVKKWSLENGDPFKDFELRFRYRDDVLYQALIKNPAGSWCDLIAFLEQAEIKYKTQNTIESVEESGIGLAKLLIVLLATKNVVKTRTKDKLLAMGIGKHKNNMRPLYTTTLTLPKPEHMETEGPVTPGTSPRPHLRRGHIRNQKHGPKLQFIKRIWIEPVFVNADENFVSSRTAYNTKEST